MYLPGPRSIWIMIDMMPRTKDAYPVVYAECLRHPHETLLNTATVKKTLLTEEVNLNTIRCLPVTLTVSCSFSLDEIS